MIQLVKCDEGETCHLSSLLRRRGSPSTFGELSLAVDTNRLNWESPLLSPDLLGEFLRDPQMCVCVGGRNEESERQVTQHRSD